MGSEISALVIQPLLLGIATTLMIYGELKYKDESTNKMVVGIAIAVNILAIIIGVIMALMV